jgi:exonuclease III
MRDMEIHWKHHPPNVLCCVLEGDKRQIYLCTIHLQGPGRAIGSVISRKTLISPSKSSELAERIEQRRQESEATSQWVGSLDDYPLIVAGDFNMPADSSIYRRYWGKYTNAFSSAGFGFGNTKHSPVAGWSFGARIDHILTGPGFRAVRCWVGPDVGSDHLPVLADIGLEPLALDALELPLDARRH